MGACIQPDNPISWDFRSKELIFTVAGGVTFLVSTVAICYFLLSAPPTLSMKHIVGFTFVDTMLAAGLACFVVGIVLSHLKHRRELEELIIDLKTMKEIKVDEIELPETDPASLNYIDTVRQELPKLFDAFSDVLEALADGNYQSENKATPDDVSQKIRQVFTIFTEQVDQFLATPCEVMRIAVGIVAFSLLDDDKMETLLQKPHNQVLAGIANALSDADENCDETQQSIIKQILQTLSRANQHNLSKGELRSLIQKVKDTYARFAAEQNEEKKFIKLTNYKTALTGLIDYLYMNANVEGDKLETWAAHLIPPFLEQLKTSIMDKISFYFMYLHWAYSRNGLFNDSKLQHLVSLGNSFVGKPIVLSYIDSVLGALPLIPERKAALKQAIETLYPVIFDPFYHATFDASHAFRTKAQGVLGDPNLVLPDVNGKDWQGCIETYAEFLRTLATRLTE